MKYQDLSEEAKSTIKGMVHLCIDNGYCMGMNEGLKADASKEDFRVQLEKFSEYEKG